MKQFKAFVRKILWAVFIACVLWLVVMGTTKWNERKVSISTNTIEKEVIKEVNHLDPLYEEREAELAEKYQKIQSIEARIDVNQAEMDRLQAQITADRAELSSFMTATALKR